MAVLMLPALVEGHASLAGIGAMFAFLLWAAVAAVRERRRPLPPGAVGDPFAMGVIMAAPYLATGLAGHAHGQGGAVAGSSAVGVVLGLVLVVAWALLRAGSARAQGIERFGFWWCLLMMAGMVLAMAAHR